MMTLCFKDLKRAAGEVSLIAAQLPQVIRQALAFIICLLSAH